MTFTQGLQTASKTKHIHARFLTKIKNRTRNNTIWERKKLG